VDSGDAAGAAGGAPPESKKSEIATSTLPPAISIYIAATSAEAPVRAAN
jgi:hypothetical protein